MDNVQVIQKIVAKANRLARKHRGAGLNKNERIMLAIDLSKANEINNLNLDKLVKFKEVDLMHDVFGISRHLDRKSGELKDCFWPRCGSRS